MITFATKISANATVQRFRLRSTSEPPPNGPAPVPTPKAPESPASLPECSRISTIRTTQRMIWTPLRIASTAEKGSSAGCVREPDGAGAQGGGDDAVREATVVELGGAGQLLGRAQVLDARQDPQDGIGQPPVAQGPRDLAVLDQEGPVAGHGRDQRLLRAHDVLVPEAGHIDAPLDRRAQLLQRGGTASRQDQVARPGPVRRAPGCERVAGRRDSGERAAVQVVHDRTGD